MASWGSNIHFQVVPVWCAQIRQSQRQAASPSRAGTVVELAVAVVLGTAFTDLIASATKVMPSSWSPGEGGGTTRLILCLAYSVPLVWTSKSPGTWRW